MPFKFGVDSSGNYGYIKDGADTVTPFRTGNATTAQVLSGYTFANATYPNLTGAMPNNGGTSTSATYSLDSTNSRVVATIPANGYYNTSSKLYATYASVRTLIGLTAAKIVKGNTILGLAGTSVGEAECKQLIVSSLKNTYPNLSASSTLTQICNAVNIWNGITASYKITGTGSGMSVSNAIFSMYENGGDTVYAYFTTSSPIYLGNNPTLTYTGTVSSCSGSSGCTIQIQLSTNNSSWTSLYNKSHTKGTSVSLTQSLVSYKNSSIYLRVILNNYSSSTMTQLTTTKFTITHS